MNEALNALVDQMALEQLGSTSFQGDSLDIGTGRVYGGQVLGQAFKAGQSTVRPESNVHSMHAYFLRQGNHDIPIRYEVDITRDGRSFSTRRVVAYQDSTGSKPIFISDISFQIEEDGLEFQSPMPLVTGPESLLSLADYPAATNGARANRLQNLVRLSAPFDLKPVVKGEYIPDETTPYGRNVWLRTTHHLPDDHTLHCALLAYMSDYGLVATSLVPHSLDFGNPELQLASIDHAMWFHRPFRVDDWLLYACVPLSTSNGRGLSRGSFYDREGRLIASTIQEGLIRQIKKGE